VSDNTVHIDPELQERANALASRLGVSDALHEEDHILRYVMNRSGEAGLDDYFLNGAEDASRVRRLIHELKIGGQPKVLEFASGFGRVTRHLLPSLHNLQCCDIHPAAVAFLADSLGVTAVLSSANPAELQIDGDFDLVFALSLFSHLPDSLFGSWLGALARLVRPGGYVMFTTHGEHAARSDVTLGKLLEPAKGFGFARGSDQPDLDGSIYGTMVCSPSYVIAAIYRNTTARIVSFLPGEWWGFQDQWIISGGSQTGVRRLIRLLKPKRALRKGVYRTDRHWAGSAVGQYQGWVGMPTDANTRRRWSVP
jgi:SAM-dependent methyltransferase